MVAVITILQVNVVMSLLLYIMFLAYMCGIQAPPPGRHTANPDPVSSLIFQVLQAEINRGRAQHDPDSEEEVLDSPTPPIDRLSEDLDYLQEAPPIYQPVMDVGWEVLQHKGYNSPRVLLSMRPPLQPPPPYLMDDFTASSHAPNRTRKKRQSEHRSSHGEYSVCDSQSQWVTNKSSAVDIHGRQVTVLSAVRSGNTDVRQYFYETRCHKARPTQGGCRGIDDRHWNSQCKTTQTFVRALTSDQTSVGWRWIRIDTSCVCALSRKHRRV
ncbi:neurotrophin-3-like isoform X2 [Paramormyrops kingsleyae]|uniref:Neurotrophin-3 n=1 Tax=Paramormyrops kingsleyae TaxID=1676925 RepID=A0A3B3R4F9_9TELE|nr:neurotrophin-3-like isoform X2 [Paramormyrops kingsleyae]